MSRECRKCKSIIPYIIKVDGVSKNLSGRKFCTNCVPWGTHNTKASLDEPNKSKRYCDWTEEKKDAHKLRMQKRGRKRKIKLIELAGCQCVNCKKQFTGCVSVFCFHHRNPAEKKFGLSSNNLWSYSWEVLLEEFDKCDFLCLNCHTEEHWRQDNEGTKSNWENNNNFDDCVDPLLKPAKEKVSDCAICGTPIFSKLKYCSNACAKFASRKVERPTKEELAKLLWEMPTTHIAKDYGVCDKAVAKWAKAYDIEKPPRGYWQKLEKEIENKPTKEELAKLLWQIPIVHIAAKYNVNEGIVYRWAEGYLLERPKSGYWRKVEMGCVKTEDGPINKVL